MGDYLLAPHNDDEALFAAYTCLRHRPTVVVVLRSFIEAATYTPPGPTYEVREAETAAACAILGCTYVQWEYPDSDPPWADVRARIEGLQPDRLWAPLPEQGGHDHHNAIGSIARLVHPGVEYYATYTRPGGKSTVGEHVEPTADEAARKLLALECYPSQSKHPTTRGGFIWPRDEYLSSAPLSRTP